jgi:hypothetical protein
VPDVDLDQRRAGDPRCSEAIEHAAVLGLGVGGRLAQERQVAAWNKNASAR